MEQKRTPAPGSAQYNPDQPQELNIPEFNSTTEKRKSGELPAVENMNDEQQHINPHDAHPADTPRTNLGNERKPDEKEKEKIIRR